MKKKLFLFGLILTVLSLVATPVSAHTDKVTVMTRNLYLGADIFKVLEAAQNPDPALGGLDVPVAVAELFQTVQYTNFPERAEAIANEIFVLRPQLVGLQEVSKWFIQTPSDFFTQNPQPAEVVVYDFLQLLMDALEARGLNYHVAVASTGNADVELPMFTGWGSIPGYPDPVPTFSDVRLLDRDVILVRGDVEASNPAGASYSTNVSESIGGVELAFTRGWVAVDVNVNGEDYRFVNTHLEVRSSTDSIFRVVQSAQMQELLTILSYEPKQIILAGDFNSSPTDVPGQGYHPDLGWVPYVPPYMLATAYFNYRDAWDYLFWPRDGFTSGFNETVDDPTAQLTSRIDIIFLSPGKKVKNVLGLRTGAYPFCMTPSGLWPSDHAGVYTYIVLKN